MASDQPLIVTATVREFEMQPAQGMPPGVPQVSDVQPVPSVPTLAPPGPVGQLQISVPTGCQAGQTLQFTPPGYLQPLSVVMQQEVPPGSVVTVQYPTAAPMPTAGLPGVAQQNHALQPGALPPMQFNSDYQDTQASNLGWVLYIAGCVCMLFVPFIGCALWVVVACMYYCKTPAQRSQLPRSRTPALTALITCITCCCLGSIFFFVCIAMLMHCQTIDEKSGQDWHDFCDLPNNPSYPTNRPWEPPSWHTTPGPEPYHPWTFQPDMAAGFEVKAMDASIQV